MVYFNREEHAERQGTLVLFGANRPGPINKKGAGLTAPEVSWSSNLCRLRELQLREVELLELLLEDLA